MQLGIYQHYSLLITKIKQALAQRADRVVIKNFRTCSIILQHLLDWRYITTFSFDRQTNTFTVFLRYNHRNDSVLNIWVLCSTGSRNTILRLPAMRRLMVNKGANHADYLFLTKIGILNLEQALERGFGGILLYKLK